jgi:hypothetical protein
MPTITMALPTGLSMKINQLGGTELADCYGVVNKKLFDARKSKFGTAVAEKQTYGGVACTINNCSKDPNYSTKKEQLKIALEQIKGKAGYALPGNKLTVWCHSVEQASVGYVLAGPEAHLILGTSATEKSATVLVADMVHDYYKPTITVNAKAKRCLTAIFHEFGHIFHQLQNPSHYFAVSQLPLLGGKADSELLQSPFKEKHERFFADAPTVADMKAFVADINKAAVKVSGYASKHPNEVVSEVFSGLVMGAPFDDVVVKTYEAIGGPKVVDGLCHIRKGQDNWFKKVTYPIAKAIIEIGQD